VYLQAGLTSFDGCDISRNTTADNDQVFLFYFTVSAHSHDKARSNVSYQPQKRSPFVAGSGSKCSAHKRCFEKRAAAASLALREARRIGT